MVLTLATDVSVFPSRPGVPGYPPDDRDPVVAIDYQISIVDAERRIQDLARNGAASIDYMTVTHGAPPAATPSGPRSPGGGGGGTGPSEPTDGAEDGALVASAGADVAVEPGASVTLDGSGSSGPGGGALAFAWEQVSGAAVTLAGATTARATFTAPAEPGDLVFRLTVTDPGGLAGSDEVTVTVRDTAPVFEAPMASLVLAVNEAMEPAVLPAASGGNGRLSYGLASDPAGLAGLAFDAASRRLSGTPAAEGEWVFTWRGGRRGRQPGGHGCGDPDVPGDGGGRPHGAGEALGAAHPGGGGAACGVERARQHRGAVCGLGAGERSDAGRRDGAVRDVRGGSCGGRAEVCARRPGPPRADGRRRGLRLGRAQPGRPRRRNFCRPAPSR